MAAEYNHFYRNYTASDSTYEDYESINSFPNPATQFGWSAPNGYVFKEWNTERDGSGDHKDIGDEGGVGVTSYYAIWELIIDDVGIAGKLQRLSAARNNIILRLKNKGVNATNHGFEDFADDVENIFVGTDTSDATLSGSNQLLSGVTAYARGIKYTGNIATKTASNLTASGKTVTVPAGYYASQATKDVATGSATTPATTITKNPTISVNTTTGVITASVSGTQSVTPTVSAGYVSSGTAGTITVSGSNTSQLQLFDGTVQPVPINPISFTIGSDTYVAESGMTWQEFINSSFNTDNHVSVTQNLIYYYDGSEIRTGSNTNVLPTDVITNNATYYLHGVT